MIRMAIFSKESLEVLRQRVDLADLLSSHLDLKRAGATYKGLCPFHDEKTPSFTIQKGDSHYHCFGCGAHGDAIQFLMSHLRLSFLEAVENLAQRFHVHLEKEEVADEKKGPSKTSLKDALEHACKFYHFTLLHTPEGHQVLNYLYGRGLDLDFIRHFQIGLAPLTFGALRKVLHAKFVKDEVMIDAGLIAPTRDGSLRDFFSDRITFPIRDATGAIIGFSARKYKEETFGGKYINTPETPLFKKSRVLFGLNYCRRRIAKERKAIIVEGQIDALRLIQAGFNITVAGQGTAFGEGHVKELLTLGINQVFLALDADEAGKQAAYKIGNLFQREGVEVIICALPQGSDPDSFLREYGPKQFLKILYAGHDYLSFLVSYLGRTFNSESPAGKNQLIQEISKQIRTWNNSLMIHESLRKLAKLTQVPEEMIGVGQEHIQNIYLKKTASIGIQTVDPDRIMEADVLRWLLLLGESKSHFIDLAQANITPDSFYVPTMRNLYQTYLNHYENKLPCDLMSLAISLDDAEGVALMSSIMEKKVNRERAEQHFNESIQKILDRNWMRASEVIKMKIHSGQSSDEEATELIKQFNDLKRTPPKVKNHEQKHP